MNDKNAAPVAVDTSEASESSDAAGEESSMSDDAGVTWVKITEETSAEAEADSS